MRRFTTILVLMIFTSVNVGQADTTPAPPDNGGGSHSISTAQAADSPASSNNWISKALIAAGGVTVAIVGVSLTYYSANGLKIQIKAAYVQQIQEDAADYLAQGTVSALLSEMFGAVRETNPDLESTATDSEIATDLLAVNPMPNQ